MKKIIIITSSAEPYLGDSAYKESEGIVKGDYGDVIGKLAVISKEPPLLVLIFVHKNEYSDAVSKLRSIKRSNFFIYSFVVFGSDEDFIADDFVSLASVSEMRTSPLSSGEYKFIVKKSFAVMDKFLQSAIKQSESAAIFTDTRQDQEDLINIGRALSIEKDPDKLLSLILFLSKKITGADAGSIYLVEYDEEGNKRMRFKTSETFARDIPLTEFLLPLNKNSIAGYVAVTGEVLNIPDVYHVDELNLGLKHDSSFDKKNDYLTRSMLIVPMMNHANEVIGVIQLINSKEDIHGNYRGSEAFNIELKSLDSFDQYVVPFDEKYNDLLQAIAGQAAVAIENNRLMIQIQTQFDEFVKASVTAIESRDPETSGHSFRVAEVCVAMAKAINEVNEGYLAPFYFNETAINEIEFAALLHDFGKVYVDLNVFQKKKKLFPKDFEGLMMRMDYLYRYVELEYHIRENNMISKMSTEGNKAVAAGDVKIQDALLNLRADHDATLKQISGTKEVISRLNEPTVLAESPEEIMNQILADINSIPCKSPDGADLDVVTESNKENLTIRKGSLNSDERREIETHVLHTYNFVNKIPWPSGYKNIPTITLQHHEKLNGTGYPQGLKGRESTMLQSRIMAIADIFDALASPDRPYKAAVPMDRTLRILKEEADSGILDPDLVKVFIEKKVYTCIDKSKENHE